MLRHCLYPLALLTALGVAAPQAAETSLRLERLNLEDGDTFFMDIAGTVERVQLAGIDAPEDTDNMKLQYDLKRTGLDREALLDLGRAATSHLRDLLEKGGPYTVVYDPDHRDRYGRISAQVSDTTGRSLNTAMVEDGFAVTLSTPGNVAAGSARLTELEAQAIAAGRGLWGQHRAAALAWSGRGGS